MCVFHFEGGLCDENADRIKESVQTGVSVCQGKTAILSRCNLTVFIEAVALITANPACRVHFVGVSVCVCMHVHACVCVIRAICRRTEAKTHRGSTLIVGPGECRPEQDHGHLAPDARRKRRKQESTTK